MNYFNKMNVLSALVTLFISLSFNHASQACTIEPVVSTATEPTLVIVKGGPRNVIQERNTIVVIQPSNRYLELSIFNEDGEMVYKGTTTVQRTIIPLDQIKANALRVFTVDAKNDIQVFHIKIDRE